LKVRESLVADDRGEFRRRLRTRKRSGEYAELHDSIVDRRFGFMHFASDLIGDCETFFKHASPCLLIGAGSYHGYENILEMPASPFTKAPKAMAVPIAMAKM